MLALLVGFLLFLVCLFVIDDLFIDLVAFAKGLRPKELSVEQLKYLKSRDEKQIAIIIANWHEADVIGRMVYGNLKRVEYKNYHFFLGVYPNDLETVLSAQNLEATFPNRVHIVLNSKLGPTSKGQMLNELVRGIIRYEEDLGCEFDVFLMHDSEDILHPYSLTLINSEINRADFLQTPIFSFDRPVRQWIGGTYIEEFAEIHTKDLFVREALGAPVPSAGVGTAIHRRLMLSLMKANEGDFLREDSLTEDYVLGMSSAISGFRTAFSCYYMKTDNGREFIATREYFPDRFQAAIRQKCRWVLGIVFQGRKIVPWTGTWIHRYFIYRDRRGPWNNLVAMATTTLTAYLLSLFLIHGGTPDFMSTWWFRLGSVIATVGLLGRLYQRMKAVYLVNGWRRIWAVPLRWPVGNVINFWASAKAVLEYRRAIVKKLPLKWSKTTHELPIGFGEQSPQELDVE